MHAFAVSRWCCSLCLSFIFFLFVLITEVGMLTAKTRGREEGNNADVHTFRCEGRRWVVRDAYLET